MGPKIRVQVSSKFAKLTKKIKLVNKWTTLKLNLGPNGKHKIQVKHYFVSNKCKYCKLNN